VAWYFYPGIPVGQPKLEREINSHFVDSQKDVLFLQQLVQVLLKRNVVSQLREENLKRLFE